MLIINKLSTVICTLVHSNITFVAFHLLFYILIWFRIFSFLRVFFIICFIYLTILFVICFRAKILILELRKITEVQALPPVGGAEEGGPGHGQGHPGVTVGLQPTPPCAGPHTRAPRVHRGRGRGQETASRHRV